MALNESYYGGYEAAGLEIDPYHLFTASVPLMADMARKSAENDAYSYRDFTVGAAVFAIDEALNRTAIATDGNWKMAQQFPKYCAEMSALDQLMLAGYERVIGMVVAATTDKDAIEAVTFKCTDTLHMCSECIEKYDCSSMVEDDLLVVSCGIDSDGYQVHTLAELKDFYATKEEGEQLKERYHHETNDFNEWQERRLFIYDRLVGIDLPLDEDEEQQQPSELARMALSAVML